MRFSIFLLYLIRMVFGIFEILIGLRIILKLFGASVGAPFVRWVYETTLPLLHPFQGAFPAPRLEGGSILEFSAFFALIIYALTAYILVEFIDEIDYLIRRRHNNR